MTWTLHHGDCLDGLATLPAMSVDLVITDPPYSGLRRWRPAVRRGGHMTTTDYRALFERAMSRPVCPHDDLVEDRRWPDGSIDGRCTACGERGFPIVDAFYEVFRIVAEEVAGVPGGTAQQRRLTRQRRMQRARRWSRWRAGLRDAP